MNDSDQRRLDEDDDADDEQPDPADAEANPDADAQGGGSDEAPQETGETDEPPFEEAIEELEAIVQELEDGDLALEDAMDRFERGLELVSSCRGKLERAELKVEELLEDGETTPVEDA